VQVSLCIRHVHESSKYASHLLLYSQDFPLAFFIKITLSVASHILLGNCCKSHRLLVHLFQHMQLHYLCIRYRRSCIHIRAFVLPPTLRQPKNLFRLNTYIVIEHKTLFKLLLLFVPPQGGYNPSHYHNSDNFFPLLVV